MKHDIYDVIIIGAGMGGLTCGAWLAHKGMKVLVVEQNLQPGGLCSSYKRNGFTFTPAASIVTGTTKKDGIFERLIKVLNIEHDIEFLPLRKSRQNKALINTSFANRQILVFQKSTYTAQLLIKTVCHYPFPIKGKYQSLCRWP